MIRVRDKDEYKRIIDSSELVLVDFHNESNPESRYFSMVLEDLAWRFRKYIKLVRVDMDEAKEIVEMENVRSAPKVRLYLKGQCIFEQDGCFMDYEKDMLVLRRGIRSVLKKYGLNYKI
ncbi:MAG TPA: hypothetical protein EYH40_05575 [Desulfurococcales archaeon]|nr:hypothetical protein [Desulfurococcales archaeon]